MRRATFVVAALLAASALTACASPLSPAGPTGHPTPTATVTHGPGYESAPTSPGAFKIRYDGTELVLDPVTYCTSGGCVDGVDPNPPSVGSPDELLVFVPVPAFDELIVSLVSGDDICSGRLVAAETENVGDGWWRVLPAGPAGEYRVELFAGGDGAGDMVASLLWTTPVDAPLPSPTASLTVIADHDGVPDSYGVELWVSDLPTTPVDAAATITVSAANGLSHTFEAARKTECVGEGVLVFEAPESDGDAAAALGDFPFTYRVNFVIDGRTYVGLGTYPDDVPGPRELGVILDIVPTLP